LSWLLITIRLSISSLAGTARTLVAVGTVSDAFMFFTTADAAPRRVVSALPPAAAGLAARELAPAAGLSTGLAAVRVAAAEPLPEVLVAAWPVLSPARARWLGSAGCVVGVGAGSTAFSDAGSFAGSFAGAGAGAGAAASAGASTVAGASSPSGLR
jgi:hypothetical protein